MDPACGNPPAAHDQELTHLAAPAELRFPEEFEPLEFLMRTHYSTNLLFSPEARAGFVEPDREPIPRYGR